MQTSATMTVHWKILNKIKMMHAPKLIALIAYRLGKAYWLALFVLGLCLSGAAQADSGLQGRQSDAVPKAEREKPGVPMLTPLQRKEFNSEQREIGVLTLANENQAVQQHWLWLVLCSSIAMLAACLFFLHRLRHFNRMLDAANRQLLRTQSEQQAILKAIPGSLFELDQHGKNINVWAHGYGFPAVQKVLLPGHAIDEVLAPDAAEVVMSAIREAGENGHASGHVLHLKLPAGESWFELSTAKMPGVDSSASHFLMLFRDITERKKIEELLALKSYALDHVRESVYLMNEKANFCYVNDEACRASGYSREELLGMGLADIDPGAMDNFARVWRTLQSGELPPTINRNHRTKDGRFFPVEINPNYFEYRGQGYNLALVRDITERMTHMQTLRRWQDVFEHAEWGVVVGSADGRSFELMNPAYARMHGYTVDELMAMSPAEIFAPQYREDFREQVRIANDKGHHSFESWQLRKDGTIFPTFCDVTTKRGADGQVMHRIVNVQDITERKQIDQVLRINKQLLADSQRLARIGSWDWVLAAGAIRWSEETYRIFGVAPDSFVPTAESFLDMVHPEDRPAMQERMRATLAKGKFDAMEYRAIRPDGSVRILEGYANLECAADGTPFRMVGTVQDITERKGIEEQMKRLSAIIEAAPDFVGFADARDTRMLYINRSGREMIGVGEHDDVSQFKIFDFHPEWASRNLRNETIPSAMRDGFWTGESSFLNRVDGREIPVIMSAMVHKSASGDVEIFSTISRDVTERKHFEQQQRAFSTHLQNSREEEKSKIAREIHDELGGILSALKIDTYWLERNYLTETLMESGSRPGAENRAGSALTRILSMSASISKAIEFVRHIINDLRPSILDDLGLRAALEWQAAQFSMRTGIECRVFGAENKRFEDGLDKAVALNLFRIAQEALTNVSRHSGASRVEMELYCDSENAVLSIRDNGHGLQKEGAVDSHGIRGMFERAESSGGKVSLSSTKDGLSLTVRLPILAQAETRQES